MLSYETLLKGVENAVSVYPDNTALVVEGRAFTYKEMYALAETQALYLLANANKSALTRVAIFSYRTSGAYIGTLTALMTGAAFVPLNPKFPDERNIAILEQCQPDVIIVDCNSIDALIRISEKINLSSLIFFPDGDIERYTGSNLIFANSQKFATHNVFSLPDVSPGNDAYILFTSGSTGKPKGVPIKHKNVCTFLKYNQSKYCITDGDRISQTFDQTFDLSVFDLFMTWCHGACLYGMRPIDLISPFKYINENKITVWFSVPSVISLLKIQGFLKENSLPWLRLSLFCGEPLLQAQMMSWAAAAPNSVCENLYGPTELTIACSAYRWRSDRDNIVHNDIVSIGKLYEHLECILVDENDNQTQVEGELCVTGTQRFGGYLNLAANACFITTSEAKIYYKTGDRVRIDASGNMLYLGRTDHQVKINGYRVELGDIEATLAKIDGIERSVVFCIDEIDNTHGKALAAYVIGDISIDEVIEKVQELLPTYMIPSQIKIGMTIPLNANGKVDRKLIKEQFSCYDIA